MSGHARAPARFVRWIMLRTGEGPFRPLWAFLYSGFINSGALALRASARIAAVYVRGSFAIGKPVYGFSDVDLIAVVERNATRPGASGWKLRERMSRAYRALPSLRYVVEAVVFETQELEEATRAPFLANERDGDSLLPRARYGDDHPLSRELGPPLRVDAGARLYGPLRAQFRRICGRDVLAAMPPSPPEYRWLWAWAETQFNWKHVFRTCANPSRSQTAYHSAKYVASPIRLWLWLVHGEAVLGDHTEVLKRGLRVLPEEEAMIRTALELRRNAVRIQEVPLSSVLSWVLTMTNRLARRLAVESEAAGGTEVRLLWDTAVPPLVPLQHCDAGASPAAKRDLLPLTDWRTVVLPNVPDETFELMEARPDDVGTLGRAARSSNDGPYLALRGGGLLLLPCERRGMPGGQGRATLRTVQCASTDPVSFAVAAGRDRCWFPNMPGWSAHDEASRAVAEHRAQLARTEAVSPALRLAALLGALRAALFYESLARGEPELPLTVGAAARRVGGAAEEAWECYRGARLHGAAIEPRAADALEVLVRRFAVYGR